jgi:hypothetical protein
VVDVLGTAVALRVPASVRDALRPLLVDLDTGAPATRTLQLERTGDDRLRLLDDGREVRTGIAPVVAAATIVWWLNAIAVDHAPQVLVHAGCVGDRSAVLLAGTSGAGKSTLTAACVHDGAAYLSDEYAALDRTRGCVTPYPRPIELDSGLVAASTLGARPAPPLAPVATVFPRYDAAATTSVTELDRRATFVGLVTHTANLERLGGDTLPWLAALAARPGYQVTYADASEARHLVRDLTGRAVAPLRPSPVLGPVTPSTTTVALGEDTAVLDAATGRVHVLNASAGLVWLDLAIDTTDARPARAMASVASVLGGATVDETLRHLASTGLIPGPSA